MGQLGGGVSGWVGEELTAVLLGVAYVLAALKVQEETADQDRGQPGATVTVAARSRSESARRRRSGGGGAWKRRTGRWQRRRGSGFETVPGSVDVCSIIRIASRGDIVEQ